ncbi:MAG: BON domain-containing protein [Beijerinckiaceae bacterium]
MAHDEDRRWRERSWRDEDRRFGEHRGEGAGRRESGRGWSEGSDWRNRDRGEWSGSASGLGYSARRGGWDAGDRWGERSGSDWEQTGWRDLERGREYGERSREFSGRDMGQSHMGQSGWDRGGHDRRQERDYAGSLRSGDHGGEMGGSLGSRYGSSGYGGRSGMSGRDYGGGFAAWSGPDSLEHGQYAGGRSGRGYEGYSPRAHGGADSGHASGYGYGGPHDWGGRSHEERGFWDKAADEVSSWFGDDEAERRREMDRMHSGRGPRNYARSDSRINEDVCDRLTDHPMIDASDIEVSVSSREVTLSGTVLTRDEKRRAEDIAEAVSGVTHVQNNLRVKQRSESPVERTLDSFSNATTGAFGERGGSTMSSRTGSSTSGSSTAGASGSPSGDTSSKTTTGSSPGVMRSDPSTSSTKGA